MKQIITFKVNSQVYLGLTTLTLLENLRLLNITIPYFCYHEYLPLAGNCRMCVIELEGVPKLMVACCILLDIGLVIYTDTNRVFEVRQSILEFLLINHPLDCPTCDQGGECDLQDWMFIFSSEKGRFTELLKRSDSVDFFIYGVKVELEKCIQCTKCIRYLRTILGINELGVISRGVKLKIGGYIVSRLVNIFSSNITDICPVGHAVFHLAVSSESFDYTEIDVLKIDILFSSNAENGDNSNKNNSNKDSNGNSGDDDDDEDKPFDGAAYRKKLFKKCEKSLKERYKESRKKNPIFDSIFSLLQKFFFLAVLPLNYWVWDIIKYHTTWVLYHAVMQLKEVNSDNRHDALIKKLKNHVVDIAIRNQMQHYDIIASVLLGFLRITTIIHFFWFEFKWGENSNRRIRERKEKKKNEEFIKLMFFFLHFLLYDICCEYERIIKEEEKKNEEFIKLMFFFLHFLLYDWCCEYERIIKEEEKKNEEKKK